VRAIVTDLQNSPELGLTGWARYAGRVYCRLLGIFVRFAWFGYEKARFRGETRHAIAGPAESHF